MRLLLGSDDDSEAAEWQVDVAYGMLLMSAITLTSVAASSMRRRRRPSRAAHRPAAAEGCGCAPQAAAAPPAPPPAEPPTVGESEPPARSTPRVSARALCAKAKYVKL